ncbi:MAG: mannose-6-phosphate isomerase [Palaeococcus sp.]|uniref:mannose-6-phosphate isomerase n=1 Tax=Palaeococcus sp. (in: euryarchaeotes) TaxID=2820298 RepID=UPI0025DCCA41|nr:mannose-6-phosphate isomerase [Palaeococcus sp. (in: euryarchaeotes)]MCD6559957.1 mannose-6-phosphate isomerase [Palaeococcus sp. (in: euryarchaeotes)]
MISKIDLEDRLREIDKPPVARINVYQREYNIQLKDHPDIILHEGEIAVVPRGMEHCPKDLEHFYVLMFEPYALKGRGD